MKKLVFIYNPNSGKRNMDEYLGDIVKVFSKSDYEVTMIPTKRKNHMKEYIMAEGHRFDVICVAGGDGTVNEAFNALMQIKEDERPEFGYIPMGTTNDFAVSSSIPTDYIKAAKGVIGKGLMAIDVGKFNESYFSYVAAFGAFTSVAYDTPQETKSLLGYAAYLIEGVKSLSSIRPYKMKVEANQKLIEDNFIFGMVSNSHSVGGMKMDRFSVDLSDGLFEVILLKNIKATEINSVLMDLRNNVRESEHYYIFKTDKVVFNSDEDVAWTLDGEFGGSFTHVEAENMPKAIKIRIDE